jgi:glycosyltransferase 2 family protein
MVLLAAVTLLVFYLIFRHVPFRTVGSLLGGARLLPLAVGLLLTVSFPFLSAMRWRAVMSAMGKHLDLREALSLTMASWTLSTFTPSKGGDLAKAYFLRGRFPVSTVLGSVLAERLFDVLTLLLFCLVGSLIYGWKTLAALSGGLLAAGIVGTAVLLLIRLPVPAKLRPKVERMLEALRCLIRRPGYMLLFLALITTNWMASVVQTWLFYAALRAAVPFGNVLAALPAAIFVGLVPLTVAGMGTRDAALIRLLAGSAPPAVSLGVGLLYSLCGYWLPGLVGLPFLRSCLRR